MRILAFDPGKTCGVVHLQVEEHKPAKILRAIEIPGTPTAIFNAFHDWFDPGVIIEERHRIVMEDWDYRHNQPTDARDACYPAGMVQMLAFQYDVKVVMQRPALRHSMPDDELSTPLEWWLPNLKSHDDRRQALRHGLTYVAHTLHHLPTLERLRPR